MATPDVPSERLIIENPENAGSEILAFLGNLAAAGKRPWCEVFYPAPARLSPEEKAAWEARQLDTFDAVELVDGDLVTLPPYAEMRSA